MLQTLENRGLAMASIKKGLVAIATEILEDVKKEATKIILGAENEAQEILKKAKEDADKTYADLLADAQSKGEIGKRKMKSSTEVEVRNRLLRAKEELVNTAFDEALIRLNEFVQTESYHDHLLKLIQEAVKDIDSDTLVVYVNSKDREWLLNNNLDKLSEKLRVKLILADEAENSIGGCIIKTPDGKMSYDNTFESRLQLLRPVLRVRLAEMLFGKGG
jgi:V/A-type H+/Na+-transporting ATPase subunit E